MRQHVNDAADAAGRNPKDITILAASKTRSSTEVSSAHNAGVQCFGENYVPELVSKATALPNVDWHFIGHLQRNKAQKLLPHISLLHTLDRIRLADHLDRLLGSHPNLGVLIQVNVAGEESKAGCTVHELESLATHVSQNCPNLNLQGLMTIPPPNVDPTPFYLALQELRADLSHRLGTPMPHLSMGMSGDLKQAILCGATIVRTGTAIFGPRPPKV